MAHHTYNTQALILKTVSKGEANLVIFAYTRELGLVRATVQGARLAKSKLKYSIQEGSRSRLVLIAGRNGWKVVSAQIEISAFEKLRNESYRREILAKAGLLVRRLSGEDDPHPKLYDMLSSFFDFVIENSLTKEECLFAEYISALRILRHLGYVGSNSLSYDAVHTEHWSLDMVRGTSPFAGEMVRIINDSLRESHL